ncbi:response regulator [Haloferax sp. DFSO60]|uniref:ATP-binding response regulator n=1 Tax=Haloferax sp. DFSO60 TaxID=3388652 RepID=UPI00397A8E52
MATLNQSENSGINRNSSTQVLYVDDDSQLTTLVATYLERLDDDLSVLTESNTADGLDRLDADQIDCIVSDYQMPGADGLEFLEAVRNKYPNLPFLLYTGQGSEDVATKAITAGVSAYVQKGGTETYELLANQISNLVGKRRAELRATVARDQLLEMFEQVDGFFTLDRDWDITYWNQEMAERTGISSDAIIGQRFWEAFPDADGTELGEQYKKAFATGESVKFKTYYEPHDYWVKVRVFPMTDGLFVHSRVITSEVEHKQELQWRNERLETFASTLSHDLKTPLNVAEGNLELAVQTGDETYLEEVARAHNRMENLLEELLGLARGENLTAELLSLEEVASNAWATVSTGGMDLTIESSDTVVANEVQLRRVFENLFGNAGKHGDAETVRVGILDTGSGFYIEDDGSGVLESEREKVFHSGYSTIDGSPGYGLSIVAQICDAHGWGVTITESEADGAKFEITGVDFLLK